jgi:hypothetical protein
VQISEAHERTQKVELRVAEQQERAAKAELELGLLKKRVEPRQINRSAFLKALAGQPKAPIQILYLRDDPESFEFAQQIAVFLEEAKWTVTERKPIPNLGATSSDILTSMSVGGQPSGVTVVANSISEEESEAYVSRIMGKDWVKTPWTVLINAFEQSYGSSKSHSGVTSVPNGTLRIVVSPKQ